VTGRHLIIAAGGTGGHMFPAQALSEIMLQKGWRVTLSTDERGAGYATAFPDAVERRVVQASTLARGGLKAKLAAPFLIAAGVFSAIRSMRTDRPDVVLGFGGYPAFPAMAAAWWLRLPRMIHEQNGVLGRVNRVFATRVQTVACSVWPTELPRGANAVHTGNPVRSAIRARANAPYAAPRNSDEIRLLVIGGSQGASILSSVVPLALAHLPRALKDRIHVSHQARKADHDVVANCYDQAGLRADIRPFFTDVPERLEAAHLVISRSGASSVADISVVGRPSVLVPLAIAIRGEQLANARGLEGAGAAIVLQESAFDAAKLTGLLADLLTDSNKLAEMAAAAHSVARPDAVDRLAEQVLALVEAK